MPFCNEIPATTVPRNPEFDNANELKGEYPDQPIDARCHSTRRPVWPIRVP